MLGERIMKSVGDTTRRRYTAGFAALLIGVLAFIASPSTDSTAAIAAQPEPVAPIGDVAPDSPFADDYDHIERLIRSRPPGIAEL